MRFTVNSKPVKSFSNNYNSARIVNVAPQPLWDNNIPYAVYDNQSGSYVCFAFNRALADKLAQALNRSEA